jgi:polar amino acid transport system substrate-binding protein
VDDLGLVRPGTLTLLGASLSAPPYYWTDADGVRRGFEADVAVAVGARLGLQLAWVDAEWSAFYDVLRDGAVDAIWSSQAVTPEREAIVAFTRPYGTFDEGVMVRAGEPVGAPADLAGRRVAAISGSTNLRTAQQFAGAELVEFAGDTDDVFGDMIAALRAGDVDAFVDDEPPLQELDAEAEDLALAFVVHCANPYAIAVRQDSVALRGALDSALDDVITSGDLAAAWQRWFPRIAVPVL